MDAIVLQSAFPLESLWGSTIGFVAIMVIVVGGIGLFAKSLSVAINGAYLTFVWYAIETDIQLLEIVLYPTLVLISIGSVFKLVRTEMTGGDI